VIRDLRLMYPETNGPGSRPMLVVLDFLQILGDEPGDKRKDVRQRIQDAAYAMRAAAIEFNPAIVAISSVSRENYKTLFSLAGVAGLTWDSGADGRPLNRQIGNPDAIVGLGKESGEIEYSADSVSVLAKVPGTSDGCGSEVIFATSKGRATGPTWSPLRFTGFGYESSDGTKLVKALADAEEARQKARDVRKEQREQTKVDGYAKDARRLVAYVLMHPGCSVTEVKANTIPNNNRRWSTVLGRIGAAWVQEDDSGKKSTCRIDLSKLKPEHQAPAQP
jgi:hypothetical protein